MGIERKITCAICGSFEIESKENYGFQKWISVHNVILNNEPNPTFCPSCKVKIMNFIDILAEEFKK